MRHYNGLYYSHQLNLAKHRGYAYPENPLKLKLRMTVRNFVKSSNQNLETSIPGLDQFLDFKNNVFSHKFLWLIFFAFSMILLIYQTYDRVCYYFNYPVAVDIVNEEAEYKTPPLMICHSNTNEMKAIWTRVDHETEVITTMACVNQIMELLNKTDVTIEELWDASNITKTMVKLDTQNMRNKTVKLKYEYTLFGICATFYVDENAADLDGTSFSIDYKSAGVCVESGFLVSYITRTKNEVRNLNNFFRMQNSFIRQSHLFKKYIFVNSPKKPCVRKDILDQCYYDCLTKWKKLKFTCSLPSTDKNLKLPPCTISDEARDQYVREMKINKESDPVLDCGCTRPCEEHVHITESDVNEADKTLTQFTIEFVNRKIQTSRERFAYDMISLLSDLGGNLGLALGLSLLTLTETLLFFENKLRSRFGKFNLKVPRNSLQKKIAVEYKKYQKRKHLHDVKFSTLKFVKICRLLLLLLIAGITICCLYFRIEYYFDEPVSTIVEITKDEYVQFPTITLCGETIGIGKQRNKMFSKTDPGYCNSVPVWKFVPRLNVSTLWNFSNIDSLMDTISDQKKHSTGYELKVEHTRRMVATPFGNCSQLVSEPTKFIVGMTTLIITMPNLAVFGKCQSKNLWHFSTNIGEPIDFVKPRLVRYSCCTEVRYDTLKIKRKNTRNNLCEVNINKYHDCRKNCLKVDDIIKNLPCKLPYMITVAAPDCETSDDALNAHNTYIEIYNKNVQSCKCKQPCEETIHRIDEDVNKSPIDSFTVVIHQFSTNIVESLVEKNAYPTAKLISDIGSIIGLGSGLSLLSFCNFLIVILSFKRKKLHV